MKVLKKLPVAPSAEVPRRLRRLDAAGVVAALAAVPVHRPLDVDRDAAGAGVDQRRRLAGGEAREQVDGQRDPAARRDGDWHVHRGAVAIDADDAGRRLIGRVDGQDFFFEERARRAFGEVPARLLRRGQGGNGEQGQGHRRTGDVQPLHVVEPRAGRGAVGQASCTTRSPVCRTGGQPTIARARRRRHALDRHAAPGQIDRVQRAARILGRLRPPMHILMIAPEPFFEPRGTPFSEFHRIKALIALGHTVDLVTYPFGRDVDMPGLRVFRLPAAAAGPTRPHRPVLGQVPARRRPGRDRAAAGAEHVLRRRPLARGRRADRRGAVGHARRAAPLRHALEPAAAALELRLLVVEAAGVGHGAGRAAAGAALPRGHRHLPAARRGRPRHRSAGADRADRERARARAICRWPAPAPSLRAAWGIAPDVPVVLYTGTFEAYQGLDLLYAAAARVRATRPDVRFLVVGGQPDQVEAARVQARSAGVDDVVVFTGQRPSEEIPQFLDAATVLASPRSRGTNTPLKIYQYLARRPADHRDAAADAHPGARRLGRGPDRGDAGGLRRRHPARRRRSGRGRRHRPPRPRLADTKYSYEAYLERTRHAYAELFGSGAAQVARGVA